MLWLWHFMLSLDLIFPWGWREEPTADSTDPTSVWDHRWTSCRINSALFLELDPAPEELSHLVFLDLILVHFLHLFFFLGDHFSEMYRWPNQRPIDRVSDAVKLDISLLPPVEHADYSFGLFRTGVVSGESLVRGHRAWNSVTSLLHAAGGQITLLHHLEIRRKVDSFCLNLRISGSWWRQTQLDRASLMVLPYYAVSVAADELLWVTAVFEIMNWHSHPS